MKGQIGGVPLSYPPDIGEGSRDTTITKKFNALTECMIEIEADDLTKSIPERGQAV